MKNILAFFLFSFSYFSLAQEVIRTPVDIQDKYNLYINDGKSTELHYFEIVPEKTPKGVIVILPSGGELTEDTLKSITLPKIAAKQGILSIIPSINWGTANREEEIKLLDKIFQKVITRYVYQKATL